MHSFGGGEVVVGVAEAEKLSSIECLYLPVVGCCCFVKFSQQPTRKNKLPSPTTKSYTRNTRLDSWVAGQPLSLLL